MADNRTRQPVSRNRNTCINCKFHQCKPNTEHGLVIEHRCFIYNAELELEELYTRNCENFTSLFGDLTRFMKKG